MRWRRVDHCGLDPNGEYQGLIRNTVARCSGGEGLLELVLSLALSKLADLRE